MCLAWQSFGRGSPRAGTGHPKWSCLSHLDLRSRTRNCTRLDWKSQHSVCVTFWVRSSRVTSLLLNILNCRSISTCGLHWYKLVPTFELCRICQSAHTSRSKKLGILVLIADKLPNVLGSAWICRPQNLGTRAFRAAQNVLLYVESPRWRTAVFSSSPISPPGNKTNDRDDVFIEVAERHSAFS